MLDELQRVQLTRQLHLWQRKQGHRTGTDDIICAWAGVHAQPEAKRILDLGAGHGAVGILLAGVIPHATIVSVEAQDVSHALLLKNIESNALDERFEAHLGDLREFDATHQTFDLVMGTPPFMPLGSGTPPKDRQREYARFEFRGGIEAYCEAAAKHMDEHSVLVIVMDAARPKRYERAFPEAGLHLYQRMEVLPKPGRPPTYLIYWARRTPTKDLPLVKQLAVRNNEGNWSEAFHALRESMKLPA